MNFEGGILALDLARRTGWAYATPAYAQNWQEYLPLISKPGRPQGLRNGSVQIVPPGKSHMQQFVALQDWIKNIVREMQPRIIVIERPLMHHRSVTNQLTNIGYWSVALTGIGLVAPTVLLWGVHHQSAKKHFTGKGNAKKAEVIAACDARGWPIDDDNDADALALLDYSLAALKDQRDATTTKVLARAH